MQTLTIVVCRYEKNAVSLYQQKRITNNLKQYIMKATIENTKIGSKLQDSENNTFIVENFTFDLDTKEVNGIDFKGNRTISISDLEYFSLV